MKKLLGILVLGLLWCNISFANILDYNKFNEWLYKNGHHQYLNLDTGVVWKNFYGVDEIYDKFIGTNNLKIKISKKKWTLPEGANPNFGTLLYYFFRYQHSHFINGSRTYQWDKYEAKPSSQHFKFKSDLKEDKYIKKQMNKTALLSYLLYEDGKITVDEISPKDRFGNFVNNETKLRSMSVGKTMVSYVMGHAICRGYIDSVDSRLDDWSLTKNTLYENQKIIDLLNMNAGDQKYVNRSNFKDGSGDVDTITIVRAMNKMSNLKKSKSKYNYNALLPHLLLNYISFKSGDDFENLLEDIFQNEAQIEQSVYFFKHPNFKKEVGNANSMFFATRHDYLRIAKSMLDDWQNDTCMGKYLKTIYENRIPKGDFNSSDLTRSWSGARKYAGFFHTNYLGMKKRSVMGMSGYGGQEVIIDFDKSRIIVFHSIHENFNWKKIAYSVIKKGK